MKKFSRLIILCILIFSFLSPLCAQTDDKSKIEKFYNLALSLESGKNPKAAVTEYKRYLYLIDFYPELKNSENHIKDSYLGLSNCYETLGNTELSIDFLQNALNLTDDDKKQDLQIRHIKLLLKQSAENKTILANNYFFSSYLLLDTFDEKVKKYAGLAHMENLIVLKHWEELSLWYDYYSSQYPQMFTQEEKSVFSKNIQEIINFKGKSPMLAAHLSFIPGAGQLYAQEYKDALNAFLLNAALIGVSTWSLLNQDFWIFSLFEFSPALRFYRGNIINAQKETYNYNANQINQLAEPLLTIINLTYEKI